MSKANTHYCDLKQDSFGLPKLPPNASWHRRFGRALRKCLTLNPNSTSAKRFFRNRSTMINEQRRHLQGAIYIVHPFSSFNRIREVLFCIFWTMEMILSPFFMSFIHVDKVYRVRKAQEDIELERIDSNPNETFYDYYPSGDYYIDPYRVRYQPKPIYGFSTGEDHDFFYFFYKFVQSPLETVLVLTFFFTGFVRMKTKEIVIEPTAIWKNYLCTYYIIDFLMCMKFGIYSDTTRLMYLLNMTCMFRAATVFSYLKGIVLNCRMREEVYDCLRLFVITIIILNTYTCFYYYIPWVMGQEIFPEFSWAARAHVTPMDDIPLSQAYGAGMLHIVCHFFGAGEGIAGTHIYDPFQKAFLGIVMITGRMWTLYVIACILKIFSVVTISESKYEEYLLQLEVFMRQKRLPQVLRNRLLEYYRYKYQNHFFNEQAIFATLSAYLRQELMLYGARKLIAKVELFRALPRSVVGSIISITKQIVYLPRDFIVKSGDTADDIYFISSGTVAITTKNGEELVHLEDGDEIGLIGVFQTTPYVYMYNYHAIETTEVYVISKKEFRNLIFDQEDLLKYFSKKAEERILNYKTVELSFQTKGYDLLSELSSGKILEMPRIRPTHFDS